MTIRAKCPFLNISDPRSSSPVRLHPHGTLSNNLISISIDLFICNEATLHIYSIHLRPGTDVMIFKIFSPKHFAKKLAFLTQNKAKL
jgi:hypothetical protein